MGRQVGYTGLVQIGELPGEDSKEKRDDNRKDIFWEIKKDKIMDDLVG